MFLLTGIGAMLGVMANRLARIIDRARALGRGPIEKIEADLGMRKPPRKPRRSRRAVAARKRERRRAEVARLMDQGLTKTEVAERLGIGRATVWADLQALQGNGYRPQSGA